MSQSYVLIYLLGRHAYNLILHIPVNRGFPQKRTVLWHQKSTQHPSSEKMDLANRMALQFRFPGLQQRVLSYFLMFSAVQTPKMGTLVHCLPDVILGVNISAESRNGCCVKWSTSNWSSKQLSILSLRFSTSLLLDAHYYLSLTASLLPNNHIRRWTACSSATLLLLAYLQ